MKKNLFLIIALSYLISCKKNNQNELNLKFNYISSGASEKLKRQNNTELELINTEKNNDRITISIDRYVTGGIPYYGNARIINDTLYLEYWTDIDENQIPSLILPSKFKYEVNDTKYKTIAFKYLGNKFLEKKTK